jgi:AcrR family transcriptional regulator
LEISDVTHSGDTSIPANETVKRILHVSEELFFRHGFSRVTVDEIVRDLGISKKTIYRFFRNKKEIFLAIVKRKQDDILGRIDTILANNEIEYIVRIEKVFEVLGAFFSGISGTLVEDVRRHLPDVWKAINEFKLKMSRERLALIVREGMERSLVRRDIDIELILHLYLYVIEGAPMIWRTSDQRFSIKETFNGIINILYGGILTEPARKAFFKRKGI